MVPRNAPASRRANTLGEDPMHVLFVKAHVKPENLEQFLAITIDVDAKGSVKNEPGCLRFDVVQSQQDPCEVWFYEVYRDRAAFEAHTKTPHFLKWRDSIPAAWYDKPTEVVHGTSLCPADADW
jgi:(4S)-4-hydroxy-5-phosphonooxypentane-2,3-dione isomerase